MSTDPARVEEGLPDAGSRALLDAARDLSRDVSTLTFSSPVHMVYNCLEYAWAGHEAYLSAFGGGRKRILFLGMNPGPWGMAQTGVPFGEIRAVTEWMGLQASVRRPSLEHPKRPIEGFACKRSEVSGRRLWGLFAKRYGSARDFFREHLVINFCPLSFLAASGGNITPDKLPARESAPLFAACDEHLRRIVEATRAGWVIGIGAFAEARAREALGERARIGRILHPSPASPAANRGWAEHATREMIALGVWRP